MTRTVTSRTTVLLGAIGFAVLAGCSDQPTLPTQMKASPVVAFNVGAQSALAQRIAGLDARYLSGAAYSYFYGHSAAGSSRDIFPGSIIPEVPKVAPNIIVNNRAQTGLGQSETTVGNQGPNIVAGWNDADGFFNFLNGLSGWGVSTDNGRTWTDGVGLPRQATANFQHIGDPQVRASSTGTFFYGDLCVDGAISGTCVTIGPISGGTVAWGTPIYAVQTVADFIDKNSMAVSSTGTDVYVSYTRFIGGGGNGQPEIVASHNGGTTWGAPVVLAAGGATVQQGTDVAIGPAGEVYVVWESGWLQTTTPTIKLRKSVDGGLTFSPAITVATITSIAFTPPAGYNRSTINDFPRIAVSRSGTGTGNVYVSFHSGSSTNCDAFIARSTDGGATFGAGVKINDDGITALQWWPTVQVDAAGNVVTHFYDRRLNPGTPITDVFWSESLDGGLTYLANVRVTGVSTNWQTTNTDIVPNFGDYNAIAVKAQGTASQTLAVWGDGRNGDPDVFFSRISNR